VGVGGGVPVLDLNYEEDKDASVDMNVVMTDDGQFVEVQGAGEESTFSHEEFLAMLALGKKGVADLLAAQQQALATLA
jgi:ribonuclease PH